MVKKKAERKKSSTRCNAKIARLGAKRKCPRRRGKRAINVGGTLACLVKPGVTGHEVKKE